jgi:hypothetical protein
MVRIIVTPTSNASLFFYFFPIAFSNLADSLETLIWPAEAR